MVVIVVLGAILLGALGVAWRIASEGFRHLDLDPAVLVARASNRLADALVSTRAFAYEPIREAARADSARARNLWLTEADGTLHHLLRAPVGELRACARIATSASFCAAAWCVRLGVAGSGGPPPSTSRDRSGRGSRVLASASRRRARSRPYIVRRFVRSTRTVPPT